MPKSTKPRKQFRSESRLASAFNEGYYRGRENRKPLFAYRNKQMQAFLEAGYNEGLKAGAYLAKQTNERLPHRQTVKSNNRNPRTRRPVRLA